MVDQYEQPSSSERMKTTKSTQAMARTREIERKREKDRQREIKRPSNNRKKILQGTKSVSEQVCAFTTAT